MTPLVSLALATLAFVGLHFALSHPLRGPLVRAIGEGPFLGLYSAIALASLAWMIAAYRAGDDANPLWIAPTSLWPLASGVMLIACILLVGSLRGNPAFPRPGAREAAIGAPRGVFAITRHPMNGAIIIWAIVHILISGSPRNLIVAGGILILALFGSIGQEARKRHRFGAAWRGWEAQTSALPFAALAAGRAPWRDAWPGWTALLGGAALWAVATSWHVPLVSPLGDLVRRLFGL